MICSQGRFAHSCRCNYGAPTGSGPTALPQPNLRAESQDLEARVLFNLSVSGHCDGRSLPYVFLSTVMRKIQIHNPGRSSCYCHVFGLANLPSTFLEFDRNCYNRGETPTLITLGLTDQHSSSKNKLFAFCIAGGQYVGTYGPSGSGRYGSCHRSSHSRF